MERLGIDRPWFIQNPGALDELRRGLRARYPSLHAEICDGHVVVRGVFTVVHDHVELERYLLELLLADDHPCSAPLVWEIGNRIPRSRDRHVNPTDGTLCLGLPEEIWKIGSEGFELSTYLEGPVRTFLIGNSLFERGEKWPHGEWAHGASGICQFYGEKIGFSDPATVCQLLEMLSKRRIKGHWLCPCGSGRKLRKCHVAQVMQLHRTLPPSAIKYSLQKLRGG